MPKVVLAAALLAAFGFSASAQMVTVTASHTTDSSGNPVNGTIFFQPTTSDGMPIGFRIAGQGQATQQTVSVPVVNGAFSTQIADTTQTQPVNICYRVWAVNARKQVILGSPAAAQPNGYSCVQVATGWCANGQCNFDSYPPNLPAGSIAQTTSYDLAGAAAAAQSAAESYAQALIAALPSGGTGTTGPQGPAGPTGATGPQGPTGLTGATGPAGTAGANGTAATIAVGSVASLAYGATPTISNAGTSAAAVFNFGIPQGSPGAAGATGPTGAAGATGPPGAAGSTGAQGPVGLTGATGTQGPAGTAATIGVGTVTALAAGATPTVTNAGTPSAAVFNFGIPAGAPGTPGATGAAGSTGTAGTAATVAVGTVAALASGATPTVTNSGNSTNATLNFGIPAGAPGAAGATGATGAAGTAATIAVGAVTTGAAGSSAAVTNAGNSTNATFNFTVPQGATGATGAQGPAGVLSVTNDTNVTGAVNSGVLTLGWQSTLAKTRLLPTTVFTDQANTYTAGMKQTFTPSSTTAGLNHAGVTTDPSTKVSGDEWYRSDLKAFSYYDGSTVHHVLAATATLSTTPGTTICTDSSGNPTTSGCSSGGGSATMKPPYFYDGTNYFVAATGNLVTLPSVSGFSYLSAGNTSGPVYATATNGDIEVTGTTGNNFYYGKSGATSSIELVASAGPCTSCGGTGRGQMGVYLYDSANSKLDIFYVQADEIQSFTGTYSGSGSATSIGALAYNYVAGVVYDLKLSWSGSNVTYSFSTNGGTSYTAQYTLSDGSSSVTPASVGIMMNGSSPDILSLKLQ